MTYLGESRLPRSEQFSVPAGEPCGFLSRGRALRTHLPWLELFGGTPRTPHWREAENASAACGNRGKKKPKTTTPNKTRREAQFPPYRYSRNGGRSGTDPGRAVPRAAPRGRRRSPAGALPPRPPLPQRGPARPPAAAAAAPARRLPPPPAPVAAAAARPGSQGCGRQRP